MEGGAGWKLCALMFVQLHPGLFHTWMMQDMAGTAVLCELYAVHGGRSLLGSACTPICAVHPGLFRTLMMQDANDTAALSELYAGHVGRSWLGTACFLV